MTPTIVNVSHQELLALLDKTPTNRIMSVFFVKKDYSVRKLNGLRGVKKHLAGGKSNLDEKKFCIFWDLKAKGYRAVNRETLFQVNVNHVQYIAEK